MKTWTPAATVKQTTCLCRDTGGKGTLPAQHTTFNTLDNWAIKTPPNQKGKGLERKGYRVMAQNMYTIHSVTLRKERKSRKSFRGRWLWLKTAESSSHHINALNKYDWGTLHTYVYDKDHIHPHDSNPREGDRNLRERWQKHEGEVIVINLKERLWPGCGCPCSTWSHPPLHQSLPSGNPRCSLSHRHKWRGLQTQWMVCMIPSFGDYCLSTALLLYQ